VRELSTNLAQTPKIVYLIGVEGTTPHHTTNPLKSSQMRKIESQMCAAVQSNKDWKSGNTSVHFDPETGVSIVRLHGNKIAEVSDTDMTIFDGGWQTVTTKSRLNALCEYFCVDGENVFQKDFQWYVNKFVGAINGQNVYKTETFTNGYIFAWDDYTERLTLSPYSLPFILYIQPNENLVHYLHHCPRTFPPCSYINWFSSFYHWQHNRNRR